MTQKIAASSLRGCPARAEARTNPQELALRTPEIIEHLFSFLDEPTLNEAGKVCKQWKQISDVVWAEFILNNIVSVHDKKYLRKKTR